MKPLIFRDGFSFFILFNAPAPTAAVLFNTPAPTAAVLFNAETSPKLSPTK